MTGPVLSLALSSSLLAVLLPGGSARVWSRSSLSPELEVMGAREDRVSLALGEREVLLGTKEELAGSKAEVEVWSVAQGALAQRLEVQEGSVAVTGLEVVGDRLLASLTSLGPWTSLQAFSRTREGWAPCYSLAQLELGRLGPCQGSVLVRRQPGGQLATVLLESGRLEEVVHAPPHAPPLATFSGGDYGYCSPDTVYTVDRHHVLVMVRLLDGSVVLRAELGAGLVTVQPSLEGLVVVVSQRGEWRQVEVVGEEGSWLQQREGSDCRAVMADWSSLVHVHRVNLHGDHILVIQDFL